MTIHELMNRSPVDPDITIQVFDLFHNRLIYVGRYDESPVCVHMTDVYEYDITGIETRHYSPGQYYITSMTITADVY
jgi:hypothetical protein